MDEHLTHRFEHEEEDKQTSPPQQKSADPYLAALLARFQRVEDRLLLISLPALLLTLILWAIAAAYPVIGTIINLIITILVSIISCIVIIRLVETAWRWIARALSENEFSEEEMVGIFGGLGIGFLLISGVIVLIDAISHAGEASSSRAVLIESLIVLLALQYWTIVLKHLRRAEPEQKEK